MVTPHPVRAPYLIQLFSHLDSLLKSFFWHQIFGSKCSHIRHALTSCTHAYRLQYSCILQVFPVHAIQKESFSRSSSDSQAILHTQHIFSALTFSSCFSFCFHFLGVSCARFPVDVSKNDCSDSLPVWKSISGPFVR